MDWQLEAFSDWFMGFGNVSRLVILDFAIQWLLCVIAIWKKTEKFYDLAGSSTFLLLAILNFQWNADGHPRQIIQTCCVCIWAFRLALFLFVRILVSGQDRRFEKIRNNPRRFFSAWTIQGFWVILTLLPSIICVSSDDQSPLGPTDYLGWIIWGLGFIIELLADYQKSIWRMDSANKDKFISVGLWSISRHPNYFGEIMLWIGLYISASSTFSVYGYLLVVCPLFDYFLITRLSGIPLLERYAEKKWGSLPQYKLYVKNTPALIPFMK